MFKRAYNRVLLKLEVETTTPLLIKAGDAGLNPAASDLNPVRTRHPKWGDSVYIPGSSLKGVIRSAAEASIRGQKLDEKLEGACDTLGSECCGRSIAEKTPREVYTKHCAACRAFGSTLLKGRISVRDLYPWTDNDEGAADNVRAANQVETRHGVAINRISGGVHHGPFDQELVPAGVVFFGEISLINYQVWQLGLLAAGLDELNEGFARLGSSKSRGLGGVKVRVAHLSHDQQLTAGNRALGVAALAGDESGGYGLLAGAPLPEASGKNHGIRHRFEAEDTQPWLDAGLAALAGLLETQS